MIYLFKIGAEAPGVSAGPAGGSSAGDIGEVSGASGMVPQNRTNIPAVDPSGRMGITPEMRVKQIASKNMGGTTVQPSGVETPASGKFMS